MELKDIEIKTELINKAIEDGITTTEDYSIWLLGYITGYRDRQDEMIKGLSDDT